MVKAVYIHGQNRREPVVSPSRQTVNAQHFRPRFKLSILKRIIVLAQVGLETAFDHALASGLDVPLLTWEYHSGGEFLETGRWDGTNNQVFPV